MVGQEGKANQGTVLTTRSDKGITVKLIQNGDGSCVREVTIA